MNKLIFDFLIIGSGPGGTTAAQTLSKEMNTSICIIEEGNDESSDIKMGSFEDLTKRYRNGGAEIIFGKPNISVAEGKTLGGGSEVNSGIYHPLSEEQAKDWKKLFKIGNFQYEEIYESISFVENWLNLTRQNNNGNLSRKIINGAKYINKESENTQQWIKRDGDYPLKQGMKQIFYNKNQNVTTLKNTRVEKIYFNGSTAVSVKCKKEKENFQINFKYLIISCGTFQTPLLLNNSGYKFSHKMTYNIHPHLKVAGQFVDYIEDHEKISNYQIKVPEYNSSFGASINTNQWKALMLLENWKAYRDEKLDQQLKKLGVFYTMIKPSGFGKMFFSKNLGNYFLTYKLTNDDKLNLYNSTKLLVKMLLDLNSEKVLISSSAFLPILNHEILDETRFFQNLKKLSLHSVHTFSSMRMGEINSETDSFGKLRNTKNVYIADSSIIPSPPGVNPQGILMTLVNRNFRLLMEKNEFRI